MIWIPLPKSQYRPYWRLNMEKSGQCSATFPKTAENFHPGEKGGKPLRISN